MCYFEFHSPKLIYLLILMNKAELHGLAGTEYKEIYSNLGKLYRLRFLGTGIHLKQSLALLC